MSNKLFNNNILQVSAMAKVFVARDGNVIRVSIFQDGDRDGEHIQFYDRQAQELYTKLEKEIKPDKST